MKQEDEEYISLSTGRIHPSTINVVRTTDALNNEQWTPPILSSIKTGVLNSNYPRTSSDQLQTMRHAFYRIVRQKLHSNSNYSKTIYQLLMSIEQLQMVTYKRCTSKNHLLSTSGDQR